jgi:hypothetical protein
LRRIKTEDDLTCQGELKPNAAYLSGAPTLQRTGHIPKFEIKQLQGIGAEQLPQPSKGHDIKETRQLGLERLKPEPPFGPMRSVEQQQQRAMIRAVSRQRLETVVRVGHEPVH